MSYEFSPDIFPPMPVSDGRGGYVIEFALGFDPETDLIVVMAVMLTATDQADALEFHFGIRKRIGGKISGRISYTKKSTDTYIPKQSRTIVRDLIRESLIRLVPRARPKYILMETYYPNLEPKAMQKYEAICGAIGICGYVIEDDFRHERNGKNYWLFRRKAQTG